ncbi:MAG: ABC transporter ATP-binding protein [Spirochaetia bacterium]|nr:ABC transporter ATP-binding protein [Spirochaetia bacterium]
MIPLAYRLEDVTYRYVSNNLLAIDSVSVLIKKHSTTALLGPNGAGKSTLMDLLLAFRTPNSGLIQLFDKPIESYSKKELGRTVGLVPQEEKSRFAFKAIEYVLFGRSPYLHHMKSPTHVDVDIAYDALEQVGLSALSHRQVTTLSGGEHQLLLLARTLAQQPEIILLDEPTSSLDPSNTARVLSILRSLKAKGITLIFTTHDPSIAADIADEVMMLKSGKLLFSGSMSVGFTSEYLTTLYETPLHTFNYNNKIIVIR